MNSDDDSYYDEEDDDSIGKGYDSNDENVDLTEFTEEEVSEVKLKALRNKLEEDYKKGFKSKLDATKLIELKTIRLNHLNVGI
jgi:hypothetical protein